MTTAAALAPGAGPGINFGTVAAIIRKDMRTLWPFALALALAILTVSTFFHEMDDYPDVTLRFGGGGQLDIDGLLFFCSAIFLPIAEAVFVVVLVQQDRATDARQDWLSRPIRAGELVLAKITVTAAIVLAPSVVGNGIYVLSNFAPTDHFVGPVYTVFMQCIFFLVLGWLCSGPMQALLAPIVLALASAAIFIPVARVMSVPMNAPALDQAVEIPSAAPLEAPSIEPVETVTSVDAASETTIILVSLVVVALLASSVVLWLLLERRQVLRARLAFLVFFLVTTVVFAVQATVSDASVSRSAPILTQADRMAAFGQHDANGDGKLARLEYSLLMQDMGYWSRANRYWRQRDTDKDGFLSREEYELPMADAPPAAATDEERFAAFRDKDANGDGKLDKTEYSGVLKQLGFLSELENYWAQRDKDKDGFITEEEYQSPLPQ